MLETESGYGRYVGVSAMPSSQIIYGIVVMLTLSGSITQESAPGIFAIGLLSGIALMCSGIYQGEACASSINASTPNSFNFEWTARVSSLPATARM